LTKALRAWSYQHRIAIPTTEQQRDFDVESVLADRAATTLDSALHPVLDRVEVEVTAIRMQEAAGAEQIFLAGQPFAPWSRGEDLEAFIDKVNEIPIGLGGTRLTAAMAARSSST
jgi:hypothetical protein